MNSPHDDRLRHREQYEAEFWAKPGSQWPTNRTRPAVVQLARLDTVDWLADPAQRNAPDRTPLASGQPSAPTHESPTHESPTHESPNHAGARPEGEGRMPPAEQVTRIAEAMTTDTWPKITKELGRVTAQPKDVRRELANHGWCDLLVGMIRAIELVKGPLNTLSEMPAALVEDAILESSRQGARRHVTAAVVNLVVHEVWRGFKTAACGGVPLVDLLTHEEALRALRILALFICPAPSKHPEVRRYALKPLGEDVHHVLSEQTEARLAEIFADWLP